MATTERRCSWWDAHRPPSRPAVTIALVASLLLAACSPGVPHPGPAAPAVVHPDHRSQDRTPPTPLQADEPVAGGTEQGAAGGTEQTGSGPVDHPQVGVLVEGFPIELLPVPADAVILVTSAEPVGRADVREVSLNLRTSASVDAVLELYRTTLLDAGFSEVGPVTTTADLAAEVTFTRSGGDELVSIGVLEGDGGSSVTIGGRVRTPAR